MGTMINVQPITRIEGHGRVSIELDEKGEIAIVYTKCLAWGAFGPSIFYHPKTLTQSY